MGASGEATSKNNGVPCHVAVIMDGNGRWANKRMLPRSAGHRAGMKRMISLVDHAFSRGVKIVTLYALSAENLSRPEEELNALFELFREYFHKNISTLREKKIRLRVIGDRVLLPEDIQTLIAEGEAQTKEGTRGMLVIALAYGGRQDILAAVNAAVRAGKELREEEFSLQLSTGELPPPDLLIRTGREKRISNFLLWELAYTELYFSDKFFPAFTDRDFDRAVEDFAARERRYGKV